MEKRDFAYFEGLFNYELKRINGYFDQEKNEKEEFNEKVNGMEDQYKRVTEVA